MPARAGSSSTPTLRIPSSAATESNAKLATLAGRRHRAAAAKDSRAPKRIKIRYHQTMPESFWFLMIKT